MSRAAPLFVGLLTSCLVVTAPVPAYAETEADCTEVTTQTQYESPVGTDRDSLPLTEMGVDRAVERLADMGRQPGEGVVVAVLDSGVVASTGIPLAGQVQVGAKAPPAYYHGTAVAGLIAGPPRPDGKAVGIAPAAQILDVQIYDDPDEESEDSSPLSVENVRLGLDQVIAAMSTLNIKVVTIAHQLPDDEGVRERVERLWDLGAIVVAPTGNRPGEDDGLPVLIGEEYQQHRPGEDAATMIHPADYANVLGVNATMTGLADPVEATEYVLENSNTDIAAPTALAVSYSVQNGTCVLTDPATSWAAAEVSGVLALLLSAYVDDNPAQAVARLRYTAAGRPDIPNTLVGAGEVQAFEALTRPLEIDEQGTVLSEGEVLDDPQVLQVPDEPEDLLASTRENAVWWGLVGGGTLLLALVLRPVLARRRRTVSR